MAMDFFQHQAQARQRTGLLLFYFFLAVFLTVVAVNAAFFVISAFTLQPGLTLGGWLVQPWWAWISLGTLGVIGIGSLTRYLALAEGGHVIADAVRARRIDPDTTDARERVLLNVVEEMAIASGTPVPTTYVMEDEPGINAFVAGFEPTQAVLVVTRGALDAFSRDELQGVVGHEFSHILNGDMRMNVQLYAILAGILLIGRIGEFLLRSARGGRSRGKGAAIPVLVGLLLMVVGYVGLFFGRLIKAAISRQRELLADASSVQFTRNPQGLAEALLKIRNASHSSLLLNAQAEDMSHMCIALPVHMRLSALLATHPPLDERIAAIDPTMLARDRARQHAAQVQAGTTTTTAGIGGNPAVSALAGTNRAATPPTGAPTSTPAGPSSVPQALAASVGQPTPEHLAWAARLRDSIPENIRDMLRTPGGARVAMYGILLAGTHSQHDAAAVQIVATGDSDSAAARLRATLPELRRVGTRLRLPCHDLALPVLRSMSEDQKKDFLDVLDQLVRLDGRITLREYLSTSLLRKHLSPRAGARDSVRHRTYASVYGELNVVVSLLSRAAGLADEDCARLHAQVMRGFGVGTPQLLATDVLTAVQLHQALEQLAALSPLLKKPLMDACIDCVSHDNKLQVAEIELVRAIGEALDCPVPPWAGTA